MAPERWLMDAAKIQSFWNWFAGNTSRFAHFESDQVALSNEIQQELRKLHQPDGYKGRGPSLTFDLRRHHGNIREFVVSADGMASAFHLARELAAAAPQIPKWQFRALILPRELDKLIAECNLDPDDIWFKSEQSGDCIDLAVFIRNLAPECAHDPSEIRDFLLQALGEEIFGTRLGVFDCDILPADPAKWGLRPISELPGLFGVTY